MTIACQLLTSAVEKIAPRYLAEEWDNVGILIGDPSQQISKVLLTLDCTEKVVQEAVNLQADMILAHHPLIFKAMKQVRYDRPGQDLVARLIRQDIMFYAAHTNLDSCPIGGNELMAKSLGLKDQEFLLPGYKEQIFKLTVFVPQEYADTVREAMGKAGAGAMGDYSDCFFQSEGKGMFRPLPGAEPFIGKVGNLAQVAEVRLESVVPAQSLGRVIRAMLRVHPYQVPAYDVIPTNNTAAEYGIGKIGHLPGPVTLRELAAQVKEMLGGCPLRVAGDLNATINKAAICTGSGGSVAKRAAVKGAGVLIAGDISHHEALDALASGMAIIDPGHYATEWFMVENLWQFLKNQMSAEKRDVELILSKIKTEPFMFM